MISAIPLLVIVAYAQHPSLSTPPASSSSTIPIFDQFVCGVEQASLYCNSKSRFLDQVKRSSTPDQWMHTQGGRYETIDLVLDGGEYNVTDRFFSHINPLLARSSKNNKVEFKVKFQNFLQLRLGHNFFSSICTGLVPASKKGSDSSDDPRECHITLNVYNSKTADFEVSQGAFQNIRATSLVIHNANVDGSNSFQTLFKNSILDVLDLKGTYIENDDTLPFVGDVDKVILTKQASRLDAEEFPKYPVSSYVINAQNIQSVNGDSFADYDNINELDLKSKLLVIRDEALASFPNLKKLRLEDVIVERGGLSGLKNLEQLNISTGVSMRSEAIADIGNLSNLRGIHFEDGDQLSDVRMMCELATAIHKLGPVGQIESMVIPPTKDGKCTCEHKYLARSREIINHECYDYNADCAKTSCQIVDSYFATRPEQEETSEYKSVLSSQHVSSELIQDEQVANEATVSTTHHMPLATHSPAGSIRDIAGNNMALDAKRKASKMNWLPIVIVTGILLLILACGIIAYLLRMFSDRRREFKPIPSNEGGFIAPSAGTAGNVHPSATGKA